jgi:hypothetical protein
MSFFSWFSRPSSNGPRVSGKARPGADGSELTPDERTRPVAGTRPRVPVPPPLKGAEHGSGQKSQRHAQRELLYTAVREAMIRAGVLSASYKFKVLSLDPRGDQFMVMMDLAREFAGQADKLAEMEMMIAQSAKSRYNIRVTAVYWRMNELVSMGRPRPHGAGQRPGVPAVAAAAVQAPVASRYEPIQADEVAAFRQALAAASAGGAAAQAAQGVTTRTGPHSYTLLTGFEDTEMPETPAPALSATQYGDLM